MKSKQSCPRYITNNDTKACQVFFEKKTQAISFLRKWQLNFHHILNIPIINLVMHCSDMQLLVRNLMPFVHKLKLYPHRAAESGNVGLWWRLGDAWEWGDRFSSVIIDQHCMTLTLPLTLPPPLGVGTPLDLCFEENVHGIRILF